MGVVRAGMLAVGVTEENKEVKRKSAKRSQRKKEKQTL